MPWVKLDDRFPSHRKVALLSDRAFRLYVAALCWSSENLTEGRILDRELPLIARVRGTKKTADELVAARLWDRIEGGYEIHDYLEYNPDRARVQADRAANAARQKAFRDRKRAEREAKENSTRNAPRNGVTGEAPKHDDDTTEARRKHDDDTTAAETCSENHEELQVNAVRNGVSNDTPSRPGPSLPSPEVKEEQKPASYADSQQQIPDAARPLVDGLTATGVTVRWPFKGDQWFPILALISKSGVAAMVEHAVKAASRTDVDSARYFVKGWSELPPLPAPGTERPQLRAVSGGWQPYTNPTDQSVYKNRW